MKKSFGFTLIELLVVIAIIGLLASIIVVSLRSTRGKARDARRKADLQQLSLALEMYYDKYSGYPGDTFNGWERPCDTTTNDIGKLVTEGFLPRLPCDPLNSGTNRYYFDPEASGGGGCPVLCSSYCIYTILETTGANYGVKNGGYVGCPGT